MKTRKLGKNQKGVLQSLKTHKSYRRNCGWIWGTHTETVRILDTLVKRGLVAKRTEGFSTRYFLTDHALDVWQNIICGIAPRPAPKAVKNPHYTPTEFNVAELHDLKEGAIEAADDFAEAWRIWNEDGRRGHCVCRAGRSCPVCSVSSARTKYLVARRNVERMEALREAV